MRASRARLSIVPRERARAKTSNEESGEADSVTDDVVLEEPVRLIDGLLEGELVWMLDWDVVVDNATASRFQVYNGANDPTPAVLVVYTVTSGSDSDTHPQAVIVRLPRNVRVSQKSAPAESLCNVSRRNNLAHEIRSTHQ